MKSAAEVRKVQRDREMAAEEYLEKYCMEILERLIMEAVEDGSDSLKMLAGTAPWEEPPFNSGGNDNFCGRLPPVRNEQLLNAVGRKLDEYGYRYRYSRQFRFHVIEWQE